MAHVRGRIPGRDLTAGISPGAGRRRYQRRACGSFRGDPADPRKNGAFLLKHYSFHDISVLENLCYIGGGAPFSFYTATTPAPDSRQITATGNLKPNATERNRTQPNVAYKDKKKKKEKNKKKHKEKKKKCCLFAKMCYYFYMSATDYLAQVQILEKKIKILNEEISGIEIRAIGLSRTFSNTRVQNSKSNSSEDIMLTLIESKKRLQALIDEYVHRRTEIMESLLKNIDDPISIQIIQLHYFNGIVFRKLPQKLYISTRCMYQHNAKMLSKINALIADGKLK